MPSRSMSALRPTTFGKDHKMHTIFSKLTHMRAMRLPVAPARRSFITSATADTAAPSAASSSSQTSSLPRVVLKGGKTRLFTDQQSPTVYGGAVDRVVGRPGPKSGDVVLVCNGAEEIFAWGLFNPDSMYRVRIMQTLDETDVESLSHPDLSALLATRIQSAISLRKAVGLPNAETTTVYRLVNSEGDRLSGLVVDVLGDVAVIQASAVWVERRRSSIEELIKQNADVKTVVWRQAAELTAEEGWTVEEESKEESEVVLGEIIALEAGLKFVVDPAGQKTGFYCDQRDHRAFIRSISAGKDVLDVCCYSGGFALNALAGGAASAHGIDSSAPAIELATRNAEMNGLSDKASFEKADSAEYMKRVAKEGKQWDIVVLDPPKLAPTRKALTGAWRKYEALNAAAMRLVRPGGILMTCSCSGAVAQTKDFIPMVQRAAKRARRRVTVIRVGSAATDHPLDPGYPEGQYLTNVSVIVN